MINNCLVTKLKNVVENDNLPLMGFCSISINGTNSILRFSIYCNTVANKKMKLTGGLYFTNSTGTQNLGTEISVATDAAFYVSAGTGKLLIPKYDLKNVSYVYSNSGENIAKVVFDLADLLAYNQTNINELNISNSADIKDVYGNLSGIKTKINSRISISGNVNLNGNMDDMITTTINHIDIRTTNVDISEAKVLTCTTLTNLLMNTKCAYNFDNLGTLPSLNNITSGTNGCVGSVEGFVAKAIQARIAAGGDGSGSITALLFRQAFPNVIVPGGAPAVINGFSWNAQGNITWS